MHDYRYRGRYVPYRPDRITLSPPRYTWPEDRERMRKEEARTQRFHHATYDSSCPDEHGGQIWLDATQVRSTLHSNQPGKLLGSEEPKAFVEKCKMLRLYIPI